MGEVIDVYCKTCDFKEEELFIGGGRESYRHTISLPIRPVDKFLSIDLVENAFFKRGKAMTSLVEHCKKTLGAEIAFVQRIFI